MSTKYPGNSVKAPVSQVAAVVIALSIIYRRPPFPPAGSRGAVGVLIDAVFTERRGRRKARKLLIHGAKATIEPLENARVGLADPCWSSY